MCEKHHHALNIIDFKITELKATFVKVTGYDAILGREFEGGVKFVGGIPYGDLIHPQRSFLSPECRQYVRGNLLNKYTVGEFS